MSILEWRCRELHRLADKLGNEKKVSVPFIRVLVIPIMREAANTIENLQDRLQEGSRTCNPVETETLENVTAHVMECDECGGTYEHVNGDYERCPHCGKVVKR